MKDKEVEILDRYFDPDGESGPYEDLEVLDSDLEKPNCTRLVPSPLQLVNDCEGEGSFRRATVEFRLNANAIIQKEYRIGRKSSRLLKWHRGTNKAQVIHDVIQSMDPDAGTDAVALVTVYSRRQGGQKTWHVHNGSGIRHVYTVLKFKLQDSTSIRTHGVLLPFETALVWVDDGLGAPVQTHEFLAATKEPE